MYVTVRWMAEAERWVAVPRQRDGWLRQREMYVTVRWMAETDRWVSVPRQRDGWLRYRDDWLRQRDGWYWLCRGREMGG